MAASIWEETLPLKNLKERKTTKVAEEETINSETINIPKTPTLLSKLQPYLLEDFPTTQLLSQLNNSSQASVRLHLQES